MALDCKERMSRAWQDNELGPKELEALVAAVYPQCLPSELRHLQVRMSSSIVENVPICYSRCDERCHADQQMLGGFTLSCYHTSHFRLKHVTCCRPLPRRWCWTRRAAGGTATSS